MKIVFMGTSVFAVPSLEKLIDNNFTVVGVVTQPDRPQGRGKKVMPTPIKIIAEQNNLPVYQPQKVKDNSTINQIINWDPDLIIVVSYGQIIPKEILEYPRYGCINVHASMLPEYRGAAPIRRAIMEGKKMSGITTMFMDEGLDTGDIIMQMPVPIDSSINHGDLESILAATGAELLIDTIRAIQSGSMPRRKQDNSKATYAAMITNEEEKIDWTQAAPHIHAKVRALGPQPGAFTYINGTKVKIFGTSIVNELQKGVTGLILEVSKEGFAVQTGAGVLLVTQVQREGKRKMTAREFLQGFALKAGTLLDS